MKKVFIVLLVLSLVACSASSDDSELSETTSTTVAEVTTTISTDSNDSTTTTEAVIAYQFDVEKMSPFTGKELPAETWLKRPRRVIAFKLSLIHI